jgi:hypothetical protein
MEPEGRGTAEEVAVELVYEPNQQDWAAALRVRGKISGAAVRQRRLVVCAAVVLVAGAGLSAANGNLGDVPLPLVAGVASAVLVLVLLPRLQARQLAKISVLRGGSGVRVTTGDTTTIVGWGSQPRYAEMAELFVMLSSDKNATGLTMLPKRGIQAPADADRLRAVLDRRLQRSSVRGAA